MSNVLLRMWVNAPSTLQPDHKYHGMNVIVSEDDYKNNQFVMAYPIDVNSNIVSLELSQISLSHGWLKP